MCWQYFRQISFQSDASSLPKPGAHCQNEIKLKKKKKNRKGRAFVQTGLMPNKYSNFHQEGIFRTEPSRIFHSGLVCEGQEVYFCPHLCSVTIVLFDQ